MNFRNISAWAIRNPVPPIVFFIALTIAGMLSFARMSVTQNPDIDFPGASISISQPGAAPTELETQVAQKVEAAIRNINGVDEINSSVREGNANIFVQFAIGTPIAAVLIYKNRHKFFPNIDEQDFPGTTTPEDSRKQTVSK